MLHVCVIAFESSSFLVLCVLFTGQKANQWNITLHNWITGMQWFWLLLWAPTLSCPALPWDYNVGSDLAYSWQCLHFCKTTGAHLIYGGKYIISENRLLESAADISFWTCLCQLTICFWNPILKMSVSKCNFSCRWLSYEKWNSDPR